MSTPRDPNQPDDPFRAVPYDPAAAWSEAERTRAMDPGSDQPSATAPDDRDPAPNPAGSGAADPAPADSGTADAGSPSAGPEAWEGAADQGRPTDPAAATGDASLRPPADRAGEPGAAPTPSRRSLSSRIGDTARRRPVQLVAALVVGLLLGAGITALAVGGRGDRDRPGVTADDQRQGPWGGRAGPGGGPGQDHWNQGPGDRNPRNWGPPDQDPELNPDNQVPADPPAAPTPSSTAPSVAPTT